MAQFTAWINSGWQLILNNSDWMSWNLFLALLPFALSVALFCTPRSRNHLWWIGLLLLGTFLPKIPLVFKYFIRFIRDNRTNYFVWAVTFILITLDILLLRNLRTRSLFWWLGFLVFIAFLPNAPYVLTDIIHLIEEIRENYSVWTITLFLIPQYFLFMLIGFEAYVLSLINLGNYLKRQGWERFIVPSELIIHALSAIGIYLGRFLRFNSWDIVTELDNLANTVADDLTAKRPILVMLITFLTVAVLYWIMKQVSLGILLKIRQATALKEPNSQLDNQTAL